mgnify:CR=1 FL=1
MGQFTGAGLPRLGREQLSWEGAALPNPPGGVGQPGFPTPRAEGVGSRETVMRMAHTAAMTMPWERERPARIAAPRAR